MSPDDPREKERREQAAVVNRLLKKLHFPEPDAAPPAAGTTASAGPAGVSRPAPGRPRPSVVSPRPDAGPLGTWARVTLGLLLAVALPLWPYAHACGVGLAFYFVGVLVMVVAGGWAAISAWQRRLAVAHVLALGLLAWGLILGAREVLPRVGYAADAATWRCRAAVEGGSSASPAGPTAAGTGAAAGAECAMAASRPLGAALVVEAYTCQGTGMLRLQRRAGTDAGGRPRWDVRNVIMVPPLGALDRFVLGACRLDGVPDSTIAAVVRGPTARGTAQVRAAFRTNLERERFESVAEERVRCDAVG